MAEAPIRTKSPLATKAYPLNMAAKLSAGAVLTSVQMTASIMSPTFPLQATTLAAAVTTPGPSATTLSLNANPGLGALLIVEPGAGSEERLKVVSISGSGPFICTVKPFVWATHSSGAAVSYEPGRTTRLFVDDTPTPSGTDVTPFIRKGCASQKYRVSYLGVANDGQEAEDEFTLEVIDAAGEGPNLKQPTEVLDVAFDFSKPIEEAHQAGATLSSAIAYVHASTSALSTTLAAQATAGDTTISLVAHPGVGAKLVLTPAGSGANPPEVVYVSAISGSGPYTATLVSDLEFTHSNGASVSISTGYSAAFLTSTTSTIQGLLTINRSRGGQAGKQLRIVWVATTSQGEVLAGIGLLDILET